MEVNGKDQLSQAGMSEERHLPGGIQNGSRVGRLWVIRCDVQRAVPRGDSVELDSRYPRRV
jgi:hypothetical protein